MVENSGAQQHLQAILPAQLKECVLRQLHDHLVSGAHLGQHKTTAKIQGRFYWVGQHKDIQQWCEKCVECAAQKNPPRRHRVSLGTVSAAYPFQVIALDRVLSTGGGGGEASTPSTISSPPKHNYELIIMHVFVSF